MARRSISFLECSTAGISSVCMLWRPGPAGPVGPAGPQVPKAQKATLV